MVSILVCENKHSLCLERHSPGYIYPLFVFIQVWKCKVLIQIEIANNITSAAKRVDRTKVTKIRLHTFHSVTFFAFLIYNKSSG